jgi:hypothetical protein
MMLVLMHYIKIAFNLYCSYEYISNIKNSLSDQPMSNLAFYLTMTVYYIFLLINRTSLDKAIKIKEIYLMAVYPASDWLLFSICALSLRAVVLRKHFLMEFKAENIGLERKQDDLFDVCFLPQDYMSDVQEEDSD